MMSNIIFAVLIYLIVGTVWAFVGALGVRMTKHLDDYAYQLGIDTGYGYNVVMMAGALCMIFLWPYCMVKGIVGRRNAKK